MSMIICIYSLLSGLALPVVTGVLIKRIKKDKERSKSDVSTNTRSIS